MLCCEVARGSCHLVKSPSSAMETFSGVYSDPELYYSPGTPGTGSVGNQFGDDDE